jgi:hypothetical protein
MYAFNHIIQEPVPDSRHNEANRHQQPESQSQILDLREIDFLALNLSLLIFDKLFNLLRDLGEVEGGGNNAEEGEEGCARPDINVVGTQ